MNKVGELGIGVGLAQAMGFRGHPAKSFPVAQQAFKARRQRLEPQRVAERVDASAVPTAPSATQSASQRVALHADLAAGPIGRVARRGARRAARQRWLVGQLGAFIVAARVALHTAPRARALLRLRNAIDEACRWH